MRVLVLLFFIVSLQCSAFNTQELRDSKNIRQIRYIYQMWIYSYPYCFNSYVSNNYEFTKEEKSCLEFIGNKFYKLIRCMRLDESYFPEDKSVLYFKPESSIGMCLEENLNYKSINDHIYRFRIEDINLILFDILKDLNINIKNKDSNFIKYVSGGFNG